MKKFIILTSLILGSHYLSAQVFNSGFENNNGVPLSEWTTINADENPVEDWMPVPEFNDEAWIQFYDFYDNKIAFSTSFYLNGEPANDWLISPAISIPNEGNPTLYWRAKSYDNVNAETYAVKISNTSSDMENFVNLEVIEDEQAFDFNSRNLDLSAYKGQEIYIAFVNETPYGYFLGLDDVYISLSESCNMPNVDSFNSNIDIAPYLNGSSDKVSFDVSWDGLDGVENYDVGLTTFTIPVVSNGIESTTSRRFDEMDFGTRYQMFVKNADCGSGWAGPKSIFTPSLLPYEYGFEPTEENYGEYDSDGWSSDSWLMGISTEVANEGSGYMYSNTSTTINVNKWLHSYPIIVKGNSTIKVNLSANYSNDALLGGSLRVGLTTSNAYGTEPIEFEEVTVNPGDYQDLELVFENLEDGIYYIALGNVTTATADTYTMRIDSFSVTTETLSNEDFILNKGVSLYPNPIVDKLNIESEEIISQVDIYSTNGKLIKSQKSNSYSVEIYLSDLQKGLYIVNVKAGDKTYTEKILKK